MFKNPCSRLRQNKGQTHTHTHSQAMPSDQSVSQTQLELFRIFIYIFLHDFLSQLDSAHVIIIPPLSESLWKLRLPRDTEEKLLTPSQEKQPKGIKKRSFMQKYADAGWPVAALRGGGAGDHMMQQAGNRRPAARLSSCGDASAVSQQALFDQNEMKLLCVCVCLSACARVCVPASLYMCVSVFLSCS